MHALHAACITFACLCALQVQSAESDRVANPYAELVPQKLLALLHAITRVPLLQREPPGDHTRGGHIMWPTTYVVDQDGYLRHWWQGELKWQGSDR